MQEVRITFDGEALARRIVTQVEAAQRSAIGTTTTWARKELSTKLQQQNPAIPKIVFSRYRTLSRVKGARGNQFGSVFGGGRKLLAKYLAQKKPFEQTESGAWAGQFYFDHAFIATMKSGHESIWKRVGTKRLPVAEQFGHIQGLSESARSLVPYIESELLRRFNEKLGAA